MSAFIDISALDHLHLYAPDPPTIADWYARVLGLQGLDSSKRLTNAFYLATPRGQYCATLFPGAPPSGGDHTTAFRVPGSRFIAFGDALPHDDIANRKGGLLQTTEAADHDLAWSYYFRDPAGNHLEITAYDHQTVRRRFEGQDK